MGGVPGLSTHRQDCGMLRLMRNSVDEPHGSRVGFHCGVSEPGYRPSSPLTPPQPTVHRPLLLDVRVSKGGGLLTPRDWGT